MPSTVVNSDRATGVRCIVASRTRRRSAAANIDTLTPRVTTRRAQRTLIERNNGTGCSTASEQRRKLIDCAVVLVDILSQETPFIASSKGIKEDDNALKIQSLSETAATETPTVSPAENNKTLVARHSNVTRRTRSRQTKSVGPKSHESLAERHRHTIHSAAEDHHSIIHLDESSNIGTKSITETGDLSQKQTTFSGNDVILQSSAKEAAITERRRSTRRMSSKSTDSNQNTISSRSSSKRKTNNEIPPDDTGVSPPKQSLGAQPSVLELSASSIGPKDIPNSLTDKLNRDAFKTLIVCINRLAPALTVDDLKRLKYEDPTRHNQISSRPSSGRANRRQKSSIKVERSTFFGARSTMAKPKLVITSPIIELPESPPPSASPALKQTVSNNSYLTVPNTSNANLELFKKPMPSKHPLLPLLTEEENEENDDVYAFLSSSQNSDVSSTKKIKQQQRKPKQKRAPKASGAKSIAKPKGKSQKQINLFGCNNALSKVIKQLGGGPVQQPATVNYKINLEIPKTPPVASSPVNVPQSDILELSNDDHQAPVETTAVVHPTLDRLKKDSLSFPLTSTPANRVFTANKLNVPEKPASPWRLQNELIVPRTSYVHRTKEMLPSYESFEIANNNTENRPVGTFGFVTERRKSPPSGGMSVEPLPLTTPKPCEGMITDKELREIEQMYVELKATSEMSERLIRAMRQSKQKAPTPQQDHTMRQACLKLKKWYDRSMNAFNRSMRIISNIQQQRSTGDRPTVTCPSSLSQQQQRTLNDFNSSSDNFRSMLAQLHSTINDSDIENHPPPQTNAFEAASTPSGKMKILQDIIILPARSSDAAKRNPLMPLNVVPLPQRDSPVMSPLAKTTTNPGPRGTTGANNTRRELEYDKENESSIKITDNEIHPKVTDDVPPISTTTTTTQPPSSLSVVEINDETAHENSAHSDKPLPTTEQTQNSRDYFGFEAYDTSSDGVVESSLAQVTLPMPLNISHETLERRLKGVKQLLPKRPIFRAQPIQQNTRSSGPTRFPSVPKLRVIGSPTKRPHTLRDFVASTPRAYAGSSKEQGTVPPNEAPDVSAIEPITSEQQVEKQAERNNESDVVALFDTPDRPAWLNNSAHQRTYSRIPKRRHKKKNIYLANLGLDDDSEDSVDDEPQELSSDSETDRKKKANKQQRKKPIPVEKTKEFKEFVESFNDMCEQVERYELLVE
ncbi:uncharacterized protein LOC126556814 [Anopheles maculipalpis]|uniref:uncharacterized protein LOC126556814 n=1 Tax=Anopheles maculipalpis TaxID=1496333 RepID=UPI002158F226|nr:uncharacterized protein LOC126556814 [Anopheles maculipalpis]